MHPFRKISLFRAFCAGLKHGVVPNKAPFKSYGDLERNRAFSCGVRCGQAMMRCAGECFYAVRESRQIPTTRTTLSLPTSLVSINDEADNEATGFAGMSRGDVMQLMPEVDEDECDDPNCGCHDEDSEEV